MAACNGSGNGSGQRASPPVLGSIERSNIQGLGNVSCCTNARDLVTRSDCYGWYKTSPFLTQTASMCKDLVSSRPSSKYCGKGGLIQMCVWEDKLVNRRGASQPSQDFHRSLCTYSMAGTPVSLCSMDSENGTQVHFLHLPLALLITLAKESAWIRVCLSTCG